MGWHFFPDFYKKLKKCSYNTYVVAHRYNKILDKLSLNYNVVKNVGLEYGAYNWHLKNNFKNNLGSLFMHDDVVIDKDGVLDDILNKCKKYDIAYVMGKTKTKKQRYSTRCFYLSRNLIKYYVKEFGNIWYDKNNKGYTLFQKEIHDDMYEQKVDAASRFKVSINFLLKKYRLTSYNYKCSNLIFYRRGVRKRGSEKLFNDNSIFGRDENNPLEKLSVKYEVEKGRERHFYTKWYNFYFNSLKLDNLNILETGIGRGNSFMMWQKYFKNSTIYGTCLDKSVLNDKLKSNSRIFVGDNNNIDFLKKINKNIKRGLDIIINNGDYLSNNLEESFDVMFRYLNPAGVYVIENLQIFYGNKSKSNTNIVDFLKSKIDDVNFGGKYNSNNIEKILPKGLDLKYYEKNIPSICFHNGICFVFKR